LAFLPLVTGKMPNAVPLYRNGNGSCVLRSPQVRAPSQMCHTHHHEPASRTRISDSYAERPLPPIRLWRHADGIWHWKGRNDLGPVIEMCSPEASTNPETSNALATYEPLPATREGLCGVSAPILLKSLGGETKAAINPPAIVDCPMAAALLRSARLQAVCKISSAAVVWKMAQERT